MKFQDPPDPLRQRLSQVELNRTVEELKRKPRPNGDTFVWVETASSREIRFVIEPGQLLDRTMTARDDYPLLATAERLEEFGEAHRALDEIDRLRARLNGTQTELEKTVWAEWNALPDQSPSPVRTIAERLNMTPADVAFIVYPAETFGPWSEDGEELRT